MRRRVVHVFVGIVAANLVAMLAMFVHMRSEDECDIDARGLVVWVDDRELWEHVSVPLKKTDLPPCKAKVETELTVLPG